LSHVLEDWLTDAARGNLNSLFDSVPSTATLVDMTQWGQPDSSTERSVPADSVQIGQFVLVKAGQEVKAPLFQT
jgi:cation transport ATPase